MDSMQGMRLPDRERWSPLVSVVRALNPGPFTGPGTNTYLLGTGSEPLLLDTGSGHAEYLPLLEEGLRKDCGAAAPGEILVTHVHPDHLGGAKDVLARFGERPVRKHPWPGRDEAHGVEITTLRDGDVIETDGVTLRAIYTPGHAQDHICFYLEEERAVFTGDVILGAGTTVIPTEGGDMRLYLETLEQLLELDVELLYPGHGPRIPDAKAKIREYIDHRLERERQVVESVRSGVRTVEAIVEHLYTDTPTYLYAAAAESVRSHLIKLSGEGRATRELDGGGEEHWSVA